MEQRRIAVAMYGGLLFLMGCSVALGLTRASAAWAASLCFVSGQLVVYALFRSGWSQRLADPSMGLVQMVFAILSFVVAYAVNPITRSGTLLGQVMVMVYGMFSLTPRQAHQLTLFTLVLYSLTMLGLSQAWPAVFDWRMELIHFTILAAVLTTIASLSGQLAQLRNRLHEQRKVLQQTLARLEQLVRHDELTGLCNRRYMLERLAQEVHRRQVDAAPACICLLDLDHFKNVNDSFGHAAGDEVLQSFARHAQAALRGIDVLARWGGEEFLLLLPSADAVQACQAMDRLRAALADPAVWQIRPELRVTFSAGVAQWHIGESVDSAIERADRQAYRAKAAGRDRWCCDSASLDAGHAVH